MGCYIMFSKFEKNKKITLRIVMLYSFISFLWIFITDWINDTLLKSIIYYGRNWAPIIKGWIFVVLSSLLFYKILQHSIRSIAESEERYRKLVELSPETIFVHKMGEIVYVNNAGVQLVGAKDPKEIIGRSILDFIPTEEHKNIEKRIVEVQKEGKRELEQQQIILPNNKKIFLETIAFKTTFKGEEAVQVIAIDITMRKEAEARANFLSYYDTITGLPNRTLINKIINNALSRAQKGNLILAVMFLDLDRFKIINNTLGYNFGDRLIKEVSIILTKAIPNDNIIARYNGDEFIILLEDTSSNQASKLAQDIIKKLSNPIILEDKQFFISPSIGISLCPPNGDTAETLIKNANTAMSLAKESGGNDYHFYNSELDKKNNRIMQIETGLRRALDNNEFKIMYQPKVDLSSGKLIGTEALLRWESPEYGFVSPSEFIPIAEKTGLIIKIGEWVLENACKQNEIWFSKGIKLKVAVNVSAYQFHQSDFINAVKRILKESKLDPEYLELEITESIVEDIEDAKLILNKLKSLGIYLSVDDFGTGYSSLSHLKHFPIDYLKIDKSFIKELLEDSNNKAIVKTIIEMGHNLNYKVIAEGIENEKQLSYLKKMNCHYGQGYLFSKPLSVENMTRMALSLME